MKNLTNILSYLWLLLLMAVTACSDLEEEVGPMQGDEEVELNISVEIPGMKAATRTVPTENITQITAIAFDENGAYIKTRQAVLNRTVDNSGNSTRGTLRIKVPSKTRSIHFLAKNNANDAFSGIQSLDNIKNSTTQELHYWGFLSFASTAELKTFNHFLTLYRNQAMITLEAGDSDYIAGFVNYNTSGTMVPYSNEHGFDFKISSQNGVVYQTIPNGVSKQTDGNNNLGKAHYLFEHENNKNNQPLYAVCKIGSKFYKVAFARTINSNLTYFPIIRNHEYKIVVDPTQINTAYGFDNYDGAKNSSSPINDVVITNVDLSLDPTTQDLIINAGEEKKCTITVTVPQGITNLKVSAPKDANGVEIFTITPPNGLTLNAEGEYSVTPNQQYAFTFTLRDGYDTTGTATIKFSGSGAYHKTNEASATIYLKKNGQLTVDPTTATIDNTAGTTQTISVTIPQNTNINKLQISTDAFEVSSNNGLSLQNGYYNVSSNNTYSFTFTLKQGYDNSTDNQIITFTGTSDHWTATGTSTITLREPTEVREVKILAEPYTSSLNYTNNSESDLIVNVTIPKEVSTLTFDSEYFDAKVVGQSISLNNGGYAITHEDNAESTTVTVRLRLKDDKKIDTYAGFTFDGTTTNGDVTVIPAVEDKIDLNPGDGNDDDYDDEYVRWQGSAALEWGKNPVQIPLPYSWFEGISAGYNLQVEYVITDLNNNPEIQFAEVDGEWNDPSEDSYFFPELEDGEMGLNLNKNTQPNNIGSQTGIVYTYDLTITQAVLDKIIDMNDRDITLLGESNVVMAIQGGSVILKKISVIPNNNPNPTPAGWSTIWSGTTQLDWQNTFVQVNKFLPIGTNVTLNFTATDNNAQLELHDSSQDSFRLSNQNHPDQGGDDYLVISQSGDNSISFTVNNEYITKLDNLSTGLNGLIIMGTNITMKSIVVKYPDGYVEEKVFEYNFDDNNTDGLQIQFQENAEGTYSATNGSLVLNVTTAGENWHAQLRHFMAIEQNATYKLTIRVKSTVEGDLSIYLDNTDDYQSCGGFSTIRLANKTDEWTEVETTATANATFTDNGRFVINFGHLQGTIDIDYLKLVRTNL